MNVKITPSRAPVDDLLPFFKALADESRLKIVGLLATGERSVRELAKLVKLREPTVSHHLSILRELDLVRLRVDGNTHWYSLDRGALNTLNRLVSSAGGLAKPAESSTPRSWEEEVLHNFIEHGRLKEIPVSRKKRWIILKWLAGRFDPGTAYSESGLNRIIKTCHDDCATIRREMVGYQMLHREKGVYRLRPSSEWRSE